MEEHLDKIDFIMPCPVQECVERNILFKWNHKKCGQLLSLDKDGKVRCDKCKTCSNIIDFKFSCDEHEDKEPSSIGFCRALTVLAQVAVDPSHQMLVAEVTGKVLKQFMEKDANLDDYVQELEGKCKDYCAKGVLSE